MDLESRLAVWEERGIITAAQAEAIRQTELATPAPSVRGRISELLAYVGAALILGSIALLFRDSWRDWPRPAKLILIAAVAVVLLAVGFWVGARQDPPMRRLGQVLWVLAVGAVAWLVGLAFESSDMSDEARFTLVSGCAGAAALILHLLRPNPISLAVGILTLALTAEAASGLAGSDINGLWTWAIGVGAAFVGLKGSAWAPGALGLGAAAALFGALAFAGNRQGESDSSWGAVLGVVTAAGLVAVGRPGLVALGALGLFVFIPWTIFGLFGDSVNAPLLVLLTGIILLGVAFWLVRRGREPARMAGTRERR